MQATVNKLFLLRDEYELLKKYISTKVNNKPHESANTAQLARELLESTIVENPRRFPKDVIRLHSHVTVKDLGTGRLLSFQLVRPDKANLDRERISILTPMGLAVIGYRKGQEVVWEMPAGRKVFHIQEVNNDQIAE